MFGGFSLLADVFARLTGNMMARRAMAGIALLAVIAIVLAIVITSHATGHTMPLAGPGTAWG